MQNRTVYIVTLVIPAFVPQLRRCAMGH